MAIDPNGVRFRDSKGKGKKIYCGDVLLSIGSHPLQDEAMAFYGSAPKFFMVGDCDTVANVHKAMLSAYSQASTL